MLFKIQYSVCQTSIRGFIKFLSRRQILKSRRPSAWYFLTFTDSNNNVHYSKLFIFSKVAGEIIRVTMLFGHLPPLNETPALSGVGCQWKKLGSQYVLLLWGKPILRVMIHILKLETDSHSLQFTKLNSLPKSIRPQVDFSDIYWYYNVM